MRKFMIYSILDAINYVPFSTIIIYTQTENTYNYYILLPRQYP